MAVNNSQLDIDKKTWNNLDYSQQQNLLKSNSKLQGALNSLGLTVKSAPNTNPNIQKTQGGNYPANNTTISGYTNSSSSNKSSNNADVGTGAVAGMNNTPIINAGGVQSQQYMTYDPKYYRTEAPTQYSTQNPKYANTTGNTNAQYSTQNPKYSNNQNQYKTENPKYATNNTNVNTNTPKTNTGNGTNGYISPKQQEWDYQDNSQARMNEIADNLNRLKITDPELFKDYDSFYNFFIDGKGRSADQIKFLDNWYANYKQTEKFNNMTPEEVGSGIANGTVPEDYINTASSTDPDRANAIKTALKDAQDGIANEGYLSELAGLSGFHAWNAKEMLYRDENKDGLDDRLYHEPTEEERKLVDENSELEAERLKLSNAMKDLQSDLTNQYPDADLSTIMLLTSDRGNKIQKSLDTLNVTQTKVQGTLKYLQTEREVMDKAGQNTIAELQKNYGIYMEYSPEGIKERTLAEYEATHITLDQADSGTESQKQMALDSVLQGYYDKYGAIIQRSKDQVINDVIAEAKRTGKTLSQALEDNFLAPLRAKPDFNTLSTLQTTPDVTRIGTDSEGNPIYGYYDADTGTFKEIMGNLGGSNNTGNAGYSNYTPISKSELNNGLESFVSDHPVGSDGGQCGKFVNDYLETLGYGRLFTDPIDKKKAITNSDTPVKGAVAVMDSKAYPQYGHTAIIKDVKTVQDGKTMVELLESNWGDDEKVHTRWVNADKILGVFDPSKQTAKSTTGATSTSYDPNKASAYSQFLNESVTSRQKDIAKQYGMTESQFRAEADAYAEDRDARAMQPVIDAIDYILGLEQLPSKWDRSLSSGDGFGTKFYKTATDDSIAKWASKHNLIYNTVGMDKFLNLKSKGATFGALSDSEREAIYNAATDLDPTLGDDDYREALRNLREQIVVNSHGMLNGYGASAQARQANYIADSLYGDLF